MIPSPASTEAAPILRAPGGAERVVSDIPASTSLYLPRPMRDRVTQLAADAYPSEACGVLIGERRGDLVEVHELTQSRNLKGADAQDEFELDPLSLLEADEIAEQRGLEVVGIWHTHPDHDARPSLLDRDQAWEGWSYLIAAVSEQGVEELRSWRLGSTRFQAEEVGS